MHTNTPLQLVSTDQSVNRHKTLGTHFNKLANYFYYTRKDKARRKVERQQPFLQRYRENFKTACLTTPDAVTFTSELRTLYNLNADYNRENWKMEDINVIREVLEVVESRVVNQIGLWTDWLNFYKTDVITSKMFTDCLTIAAIPIFNVMDQTTNDPILHELVKGYITLPDEFEIYRNPTDWKNKPIIDDETGYETYENKSKYTKLIYYLKIKHAFRVRRLEMLTTMVQDARQYLIQRGSTLDNESDYQELMQSVTNAFFIDKPELEFRRALRNTNLRRSLEAYNATLAGDLGKCAKKTVLFGSEVARHPMVKLIRPKTKLTYRVKDDQVL
jgi:hypothetical protein